MFLMSCYCSDLMKSKKKTNKKDQQMDKFNEGKFSWPEGVTNISAFDDNDERFCMFRS